MEQTATPVRHPLVLVVDDEPGVRQFVGRMLADLGRCRVLEAAGGQEALETLLSRDPRDPPDLVLTDILMPHIDGVSLGRQVRERWPGLPVLYMSGNGSAAAARLDAEQRQTRLLLKPFTGDQLIAFVRPFLPH